MKKTKELEPTWDKQQVWENRGQALELNETSIYLQPRIIARKKIELN